ncbi:hypothetical protein F66182_9098 [Fusarium sp. NRRL 66182]|nr:hypothetical protein F66182_9098 [Fusarium sp. NRRL 66182]
MGCSHSHHVLEMESRPVRPVILSNHSAGSVMMPSTFQDQPEPGLTRQQIMDAFQHMAEYLNECGVSIECVAVDGAVNTLYLHSKESTHDVEFLLDPASDDYKTLSNAAVFANRQAQEKLGCEWFNNSMQLFVPQSVQTALVQEAKHQDEVVFEHQGTNGGLKVYAAPWSFAFCGKLNRLCDIDDAIVYLHRYLSLTGQDYVIARWIYDECQKYHQDVSQKVLKRLEDGYARTHGNWPIVWN